MLTHLTIENFALIEKCSLEFFSGMTVITGETGAGKSIILDALELALGKRAESFQLRSGAEKGEITAVFDIAPYPHIKTWLCDKNIAAECDATSECFLKRVISQDGRSRSFINYQPVPLQLLKELAGMLVNFHGQHEHQAILARDTQRQWCDIYGHHEKLLEKIKAYYEDYKNTLSTLEEISASLSQRESRLDFLRYQIKELSELDFNALDGEKIQSLELSFKSLIHAKDHLETYHHVLSLLENQFLPDLHKAKNSLLVNNAPDFSSYFENAHIQLTEACHDIQAYVEKIECHPEKLQEIEKQLDNIHRIARKHQIKPEELPLLNQRLQQELNFLETAEQKSLALQNKIAQIKSDYLEVAQKLSLSRKKAAKAMAKEIEQYCHELSMEHAQFSMQFTPYDNQMLTPHGLEKIEFLICLNPGQPLQPLNKVASGGELSRISLAIDLVGAKDQTLPVLIFDEADAGISGETAVKVGKCLKNLSQKAQIICITHLAQIACEANQHLYVEKNINISQHKTSSHIRYLTLEDKVKEIARLLGGDTKSTKALSHARELVKESS